MQQFFFELKNDSKMQTILFRAISSSASHLFFPCVVHTVVSSIKDFAAVTSAFFSCTAVCHMMYMQQPLFVSSVH